MTITLIAAVAALSIAAYRRSPSGEKISGIRQSTAVVLAVADAVWAVLDALVSLVRPRAGGGGSGMPLRRPGVMVASDVAE